LFAEDCSLSRREGFGADVARTLVSAASRLVSTLGALSIRHADAQLFMTLCLTVGLDLIAGTAPCRSPIGTVTAA